jgi:hypothetical protein
MSVVFILKILWRIEMNKRYELENKENKKKKVIIVLIIVFAIAATALFLLKSCNEDQGNTEPKTTPVFLEDKSRSIDREAQTRNQEDILEELKKQQLIVTDKLSSNIIFNSGEVGSIGEWVVENLKENDVIQQAEVYWNDVLIAKTTPIYPNQHIKGVSLLESIAPGEYEATAYLNYYDTETKEFLSKAGYSIHLTVR